MKTALPAPTEEPPNAPDTLLLHELMQKCGLLDLSDLQRPPSNDLHVVEPEKPPDPRPLPAVLTVDDVAALLRISKKSIYGLVERHVIPHLRIGKHLRFLPADIYKWMQQMRRPALEGTSSGCCEMERKVDSRLPAPRRDPRETRKPRSDEEGRRGVRAGTAERLVDLDELLGLRKRP